MRKGPVTLLVWWGQSWLRGDVAEPCPNSIPCRGWTVSQSGAECGNRGGISKSGSLSRVTAMLPSVLGALHLRPPHPTGTPVPPQQRSCGAVGSLTQPHWAAIAVEGW